MIARELQVAVEPSALPRLTAFLQEALAESGIDAAHAYSFELALEEIFVNVLMHGSTPDAPPCQFEARITAADHEIRMVFSDNGRPFDPLSQPPPALDVPIEERSVGGLGIHLVREMMDSVSYWHDGGRNHLSMSKRVP